MDSIRIEGGRRLAGRIAISGAKNAALPLMCASLLTDRPLVLSRVPELADIKTLSALLRHHGASVTRAGDRLTIAVPEIADTTAPYDLVRKMRASILVLGPILARMGEARVSQPGGCAIGNRPVDLHVKGLQALGAEIDLDGGYITAKAKKGLVGNRVVFPLVSVGATENLLMAAALAKGETQLVNAAREPEITDLARCLVAMGATIEGIGTDTLYVQGVDSLAGADHPVVADRIEAGTYAMAAAITRGDIALDGFAREHLAAVFAVLERAGCRVTDEAGAVRVSAEGRLTGVDVMTEPFPGFPTDLQAQFMALMCVADGASMITETIFENRFMHVPELARMGARVTIHTASALVRGVAGLTGAPVMATDLRASSSLVLAGLAARGSTTIGRVYHLDRGYDRLEEKLTACGAEIRRVRDDDPE